MTEEDLHFKLSSGEEKFRSQECQLPPHFRLHVSSDLHSNPMHARTRAADSRTLTKRIRHCTIHTRAEMGSTAQVTAPPELVNKMVAKGVRFAQTESISPEILPLLNPVLYAVTGLGLSTACQSLPVCVRGKCAHARTKARSNHQEVRLEVCTHMQATRTHNDTNERS